jgi:hypothetical protein
MAPWSGTNPSEGAFLLSECGGDTESFLQHTEPIFFTAASFVSTPTRSPYAI